MALLGVHTGDGNSLRNEFTTVVPLRFQSRNESPPSRRAALSESLNIENLLDDFARLDNLNPEPAFERHSL